MPKIRKKTSNRVGTHQREKIKKKISEAKRKIKRAAKKDVTWKNPNKEKDLGIPSKFPFKDQILADAAELKVRRDEDKILAREKQKAAHQAASLGLPDPSLVALANSANPYGTLGNDDGDESLDEDTDEEVDNANCVSSSLKLHAKSLKEVISKSDIIVQVLDARDPEGTRSRKIEREVIQVHGKKLVMVMNKIDLVPKENVEAWLKYLRISFPTLPFKSSTQSQRKNLSSTHGSHVPQGASSSSPAPLLTLLKNYSRAGSLNIGVIGFPNVGKSSLINTLKRSKACGVAPTPGFTKEVQIISLDGSLKILDCPGVVYEGGDQGPEKVLRNYVAVEQVQDPIASVEVILRKCKKEHLMMLYNIPAFDSSKDFMIAVARVRGRIKKGGVPDLVGTARSIIRDWNAGRIPYYTLPPAVPLSSNIKGVGGHASASNVMTTSTDIGSVSITTSLAPEFDLDGLFKEADAIALDGAKSTKDSSFVRMNESMATEDIAIESGDAFEYKLMGEKDQNDEDIELVDVEENLDSMAAIVSAKSKGKKRKSDVHEPTLITTAPAGKTKRVNFEDGTVPGGGKVGTSTAKTFADNPDEAPIQLNKDIKKSVKKAKKNARKEVRNNEREENELSNAFGSVALKTGATAEDETLDGAAPKPYDFSAFFGGR